MDKEQIAMCGAYCGACDWKEKTNCPGCKANKGEMFWGRCAVATCCLEKELAHCGLCPELPCSTLQEFFDNPEHGDNGQRLANLKAWARGEDTFLKLTPKDN